MAGENLPGERPVWPQPGKLARHLGVVAAVVGVWGFSLYGVIQMGGPGQGPAAEESDRRRERRRAQAAEPTAVAATDEAASSAVIPDAAPSESTPHEAGPAQEHSPQPEAPKEEVAVAAASPAVAQPEAAAHVPSGPEPSASAPADEPPSKTASAFDPPPEALGQSSGEASSAEPMEFDMTGVEAVSFVDEVFPILDKRCVKCHGGPRDEGGQRIEEGLNLLTWEDVMAGSTWGSVVEPGDLAGSYMLELILSGDMPEKEPRLLPREIRAIQNWIASGAPNN